MNNKLSRRDFLRLGGLAAIGTVLAGCAPATEAITSVAPTEASNTKVPATTVPGEEITLDVVTDVPEYDAVNGQILDVFAQNNPGIKINLTSFSEDGQQAYAARIAGGYAPAMETVGSTGNTFKITGETYQNFVDLSTIDYPYWDQWLYDVKDAWSNLYGGLPGPRCLNVFLGWFFTWVYHKDLVEKAIPGFKREEVKTFEDLENWLTEGTAWAKSNDSGVTLWWDQGWLPDVMGMSEWMDAWALPFPGGTYERLLACWQGDAKFNAPDSPYRSVWEWIKKAYDNHWLPANFWTRTWETDMESSFCAKSSVVNCHGPWIWDKAVAVDPTVQLEGMPMTPPSLARTEGWVQWTADLGIDNGSDGQSFMMRAVNQNQPAAIWDATKKLFIWWNGPEACRLRAEATGNLPAIKLDPPAKILAPVYLGVLKDIGTKGGIWEKVKIETRPSGEMVMSGKFIPGSVGTWDYLSGNNAVYMADFCNGTKTVQEILDMAQANWEASYHL